MGEPSNGDQPLPFPLGHGSVTTTTRRGRAVHIRNIASEDTALLVDLYHNLSDETRRLRFMGPRPDLPDEVLWPEMMRRSHIDPLVEAALIATAPDAERERAVGVARMVRGDTDPDAAEVAIVLRDDYQAEGLGTVLFDLLVQVALVRGLKRLVAVSLAENAGMHRLVRKTGLPFTSQTSYGETTMVILLTDDPPPATGGQVKVS
jgi:RimJ/RimL family protein N-acetyltransferase